MLIFENVNAVLFFKRSNVATVTFGQKRIETTLAGPFLNALGVARSFEARLMPMQSPLPENTGTR